MIKWQPIKTAPRNGTQILISDGDAVYAGFWREQWVFFDESCTVEDGWIELNGWVDGYGPTHWMPLPPAPSKTNAP